MDGVLRPWDSLFMALSDLWILHWDLTTRFSSTPQHFFLSRKTHSALMEKITTLSIVAQFAECKFAKNEVLSHVCCPLKL